jgi:hypothetical protein
MWWWEDAVTRQAYAGQSRGVTVADSHVLPSGHVWQSVKAPLPVSGLYLPLGHGLVVPEVAPAEQ